LEESGYTKKISTRKTKAGFEASQHELGAKVYLAMMLDLVNLKEFMEKADDQMVQSMLASLVSML
jgi:hypothetical protein